MSVATSNIVSWTSGFRATMMNDPAQQLFEEQVQSHGFLFLEEYLENIRAELGNKNAIVDLVKTPGRKRISPRKARTQSHVQGDTNDERFYSLEEYDRNGSRNVVNKFHEALLLARQTTHSTTSSRPISNTSAPPTTVSTVHFIDISSSPVLPNAVLPPVQEREEPPETAGPPSSVVKKSVHSESGSSSGRDCHSAVLPSTTKSPSLHIPAPQGLQLASGIREFTIEPSGSNRNDVPPSVSRSSSPYTSNAYLAGFLVEASNGVDTNPTSPTQSGREDDSRPTQKQSAARFPSIPQPSPLRKPSAGILPAPIPTLSGTDPNKRTSWLVKAREARYAKSGEVAAKQLDITSERTEPDICNPVQPNYLKRGSGELTADTSGIDDVDAVGTSRKSKVQKTSHGVYASEPIDHNAVPGSEPASPRGATILRSSGDRADELDTLDNLRKTVEELGTRNFKSSTKSLAGPAAAAELAKARAAAEARIAGRERRSSSEVDDSIPQHAAKLNTHDVTFNVDELAASGETKRPGVFVKEDKMRIDSEFPVHKHIPRSEPLHKPLPPANPDDIRPPPVFIPPPNAFSKDLGSRTSNLVKDSKTILGPPEKKLVALRIVKDNRHSVVDSRGQDSNLLGERETSSAGNGPYWSPEAASERTCAPFVVEDEGDSESWSPNASGSGRTYGFPFDRESQDATTWSSWPTESHHGDNSGPLTQHAMPPTNSNQVLASEDENFGQTSVNTGVIEGEISQLNGKSGHASISLSQDSTSSPREENTSVSFIGQATKFVSGMFGVGSSGSKKDKDTSKSSILAIASGKKLQDEQERKAMRLKEMEARRQAVLHKKAEDERQRAEEEDRKAKEELERRRKEREELAAKRPLKALGKKPSQDDTRKKMIIEHEKAKSSIKEKKTPAAGNPAKLSAGPSKPKLPAKQPSSTSLADKPSKVAKFMLKPEAKELSANSADKAQGDATALPHSPNPVPGNVDAAAADTQEWIDLPEPNSEYSNSDDDSQGKNYDVADWAQSPVLMDQLSRQQTMDPDEIFGPIRPLRMEEMFRTRQSRFRARTSSANWSGPDGLTEQEARDYARRMGFR